MDSFTLTLYVSSLLLLQSLSFLFKDEVEEFDTSLICLSLMCAVGIKASFIFFYNHTFNKQNRKYHFFDTIYNFFINPYSH